MTLISIDPSTKRPAVALWEDGILTETFYLRSDLKNTPDVFELVSELAFSHYADEVAIEMPEIYAGSKVSKAGLMKLAFHAGFSAGVFHVPGRTKIYPYLPKEWKGQVPKEVMSPRIMGRLSKDEAAKVLTLTKTFQHDLHDAVGIGLYHLGRLR